MGVSEQSGDITVLLRQWGEGKPAATEQLFELVYPHLRVIAGALFRGERPENLDRTGIDWCFRNVQHDGQREQRNAHWHGLIHGRDDHPRNCDAGKRCSELLDQHPGRWNA